MPSTKHLKTKEQLTLALRIKNSNKEASPYLYCRQQARYYLIDLKKSFYYSKYVYLKRTYNSSGLRTVPVIQRQVYYFFISLIPRRTLVVDPPYTPYFPSFELDFASFKQVINLSLFLNSLLDFNLLDFFQAVFLFLRISKASSLYSISFLLVPIYCLFRYILSILLGIPSNQLQ